MIWQALHDGKTFTITHKTVEKVDTPPQYYLIETKKGIPQQEKKSTTYLIRAEKE